MSCAPKARAAALKSPISPVAAMDAASVRVCGDNPINYIDPTGHTPRNARITDALGLQGDSAVRSHRPNRLWLMKRLQGSGIPREKLSILRPLFFAAQDKTGIPREIQAAQFGLESGWGSSVPTEATSGKYSFNRQPVHKECNLTVACWAVQLSPAGRGYATDPNYATNLMDVVDTIRRWEL